MIPATAQQMHLSRSFPSSVLALPRERLRKRVVVLLCLIVACGFSFWQGTGYQHGIDQTLISQYVPESTGGQAGLTLAAPTTTTSSAQSGPSDAPPGP